jgi:tRNA (mo5U34)-methyltransferase
VKLPDRPQPHDLSPQARQIIERVAPLEWYHSIDLGHGVVTPGFVDHRDQLPYYQLPASLQGMRCLDVATYDGYWAFEMERRGAAEVMALDVARWADCDVPRVILDDVIRMSADKKTGAGFAIAHELLGSHVRREICNVYDLSPERQGTFDLVLISDLLLHLRNPQLALERAFSVCRGTLVVADVYHPLLERYGDVCLTEFCADIPSDTWWRPNTNTLKAMMRRAGFEEPREVSRFVLQARSDQPIHKVVLHGKVPDSHAWRALA